MQFVRSLRKSRYSSRNHKLNRRRFFRCEVRPGPEFLLRQYEFFEANNESLLAKGQQTRRQRNTFRLRQFHYSDRNCRHPLYTVTAWGRHRRDRESWLVPGADDLDIELTGVGVVAHTDKAAQQLERGISTVCPLKTDADNTNWQPRRQYFVPGKSDGNDGLGLSCLDPLHFTFHEVQLARIERRPVKSLRRRWRTQLLLGDIHTEKEMRKRYRPTALQPYALVKANQVRKRKVSC